MKQMCTIGKNVSGKKIKTKPNKKYPNNNKKMPHQFKIKSAQMHISVKFVHIICSVPC